jgi:hypothetical protein
MLVNNFDKTIIIITASPLTDNIYYRIGVTYFEKSMNVYIFDCIEWVRNTDFLPNTINYTNKNNLYKISNKNDFELNFKILKPSHLLDFIGFNSNTYFIQNICKINNVSFIIQNLNPIPTPFTKENVLNILTIQPIRTFQRIYQYFKRNIYNKSALNPTIAYLVGNKSLNHITNNAITKIYTTSQSWYDLNVVSKNSIIEAEDYVLFIDDCISNSFDFKLTNQTKIIEHVEYFKILNLFFDHFEEKFKIKIKIAAHPNGKEITNYKKYFNKREVIFDKTAELSINAKLILTHFSTAINYGVILKKIIFLLNFKNLNNTYQGAILKNISKLLNCKILDIDNANSLDAISFKQNIDYLSYDKYINDYISNEKNINNNNQFQNLINYINK